MRMRSSLSLVAAGVFALVTMGFTSAAMAQKVSGAIFTTLIDGTSVDHNIYNAKEDVYLDGGPQKQCTAAGLPEGDYYFQVTDPSGKIVLSEDKLDDRIVHVNGEGVISAILGATPHSSGTVTGKCGSTTVQLMPFKDTPNNGGEYKVWMTPVVYPFKGFLPSKSKTDNFKVESLPPPAVAVTDEGTDTDGDGLTDYQEVHGEVVSATGEVIIFSPTNPLEPDSDGDGLTDFEEVMGVVLLPGSDGTPTPVYFTPTNPNILDVDANGNGIPDAGELLPPPA